MANKSNSKMLTIIAVLALVVIALGYAFINQGRKTLTEQAPQPHKTAQNVKNVSATSSQYPMAPDFTLRDLNNKEVKLSSYKGKVVFVNFWATWCPPCRREIPGFIELYDEYANDGFVILGIAVDAREFNKVAPFADNMGMNYPVLLDKTGASNLYGGIQSIPTTFVINRKGRIVQKIVGSRPKEAFRSIINSLL